MPVLDGFGDGSVIGLCALAQTTHRSSKTAATVNREILMAMDINLETFQQGTLGPAEIVKTTVAEEMPEAKNCGVRVKIASKTQPSLC